MKHIAIVGASGTIGSEIIRQLNASPLRVRAGSRSPDSKKGVSNQLEWRFFDYGDAQSMDAFFQGVNAFFFVAPHTNPLPSVEKMLAVAEAAGVEELIFSSGRTTGDVLGKPLHELEELVKASSFQWTIFRPGWFMQNFIDFLDPVPRGNRISLPVGKAKTAFIDVRDIGAVAAQLLTRGVLHKRTLELTSSEAIDHYEVARLISQASGIPIEYHPMEEEPFIQMLQDEWGWSEEEAIFTAYLYAFVAHHKEEEVSPDIAEILGKEPISFATFAMDYAAHWKSK